MSSVFNSAAICYLFVMLSCGLPFVATHDVQCDKLSSCSCKMSDDSGQIDLTPLASTNENQAAFSKHSQDGYLYTYNPCKPVNYEYNISTCTANCDPAVCQIFEDGKGQGVRCGSQAEVSFTVSKDEKTDEEIVIVAYEGGQGTRQSSVTLVCNKNSTAPPQFEFVAEKPPGHYNFILTSYYSCPRGGTRHSGLAISGGSIFLILLLVLLTLYFVLGILFQKYRRDASGRELIPHHQFWLSLPGLVKDGFLFSLSKCRNRRDDSYEPLQ